MKVFKPDSIANINRREKELVMGFEAEKREIEAERVNRIGELVADKTLKSSELKKRREEIEDDIRRKLNDLYDEYQRKIKQQEESIRDNVTSKR